MIRRKVLNLPGNTIIYFNRKIEPLKLIEKFNIYSIYDNKNKKKGKTILFKI